MTRDVGTSASARHPDVTALFVDFPTNQQLRFGVFREGGCQKMPALEGQFLKEISVRFAGENHLRTQKAQNKALRRGS